MTSEGPESASRVRRTGIALVHVGELVLPATGSEAQAEAVGDSDRTVIHFHFPVEIHVVDPGGAIDPDSIINQALERLASGLHGEEG